MEDLNRRLSELKNDEDNGDDGDDEDEEEANDKWLAEEVSVIRKRTLKTVTHKTFASDILILPGQLDDSFDHHYKNGSPMKTSAKTKQGLLTVLNREIKEFKDLKKINKAEEAIVYYFIWSRD